MNRSLIVLCVSLLGAASPVLHHASAENWGHWRGEGGNGVATEASPPINFSDRDNVRWKVAIPGKGSGSPVVWNDQVFVTSGVPKSGRSGGPTDFVLFCIDRKSGEIVWQKTAVTATPHEATHNTNTFASGSPCTDGELVYAFFGSRGLHAFTMDGQPVWQRDFGNMAIRNGFGEGASPALSDDRLIVPWDHEGQSKVYAINKTTGDIIWETPRDEPSNWGTPLVIDHDGGKQVILTGQNKVRAYDFETGREIWSCGGQTQRPAASPVYDGKLVYVTSGFRGSYLGAFRPAGKGDIAGTSNVAWERNSDTPDIGSPLLSNGRLYFYKGKSGLLTCVDAATGKPNYETARIAGLRSIYASPVAAGGHVYLTDRSGSIVVIKDSSQLEIVANNSMGETVDATPAPVDDELFIRGERHLFCVAAD